MTRALTFTGGQSQVSGLANLGVIVIVVGMFTGIGVHTRREPKVEQHDGKQYDSKMS